MLPKLDFAPQLPNRQFLQDVRVAPGLRLLSSMSLLAACAEGMRKGQCEPPDSCGPDSRRGQAGLGTMLTRHRRSLASHLYDQPGQE